MNRTVEVHRLKIVCKLFQDQFSLILRFHASNKYFINHIIACVFNALISLSTLCLNSYFLEIISTKKQSVELSYPGSIVYWSWSRCYWQFIIYFKFTWWNKRNWKLLVKNCTWACDSVLDHNFNDNIICDEYGKIFWRCSSFLSSG